MTEGSEGEDGGDKDGKDGPDAFQMDCSTLDDCARLLDLEKGVALASSHRAGVEHLGAIDMVVVCDAVDARLASSFLE